MSASGPKQTLLIAPTCPLLGGKADIRLLPITVFIGGNCALKYKTSLGVTGESAEPHLLSLASVMPAAFE